MGKYLLIDALEQHCPWRTKRVARVNQGPWITPAITKQLQLRDALLKKFKSHRNPSVWADYKKAKNKAVGMLRNIKRKSYVSKPEQNENDAKGTRKIIKSISGMVNQSKRVNSLRIEDRITEDTFEMASEFNSHFSSVADKLRSILPQTNFDMSKLINFVRSKTDNNVLFSIPPITEVKVIDCLQSISSHKASGIDKLSPRMLELAAPIIAPSIAELINYSFNTASFPQRWKTAKVFHYSKVGTQRT